MGRPILSRGGEGLKEEDLHPKSMHKEALYLGWINIAQRNLWLDD